MGELIIYVGAALTLIWGISHLFPTKNVVKGFGDISADNKRIITMEWIFEGTTLIFIGCLIALVTLFGDISDASNKAVYYASSTLLMVMATISLKTGGKIDFLPFKLCAPIFTVSALLIIIGSII